MSRHSFVVINDKEGEIQGLRFDFTSLAMSSFKSPQQKARKLSYPGNFPVPPNGTVVPDGNNRPGFIKAEQLYLFRKDNISYQVIGELTSEAFEELRCFMKKLQEDGVPFDTITDNL